MMFRKKREKTILSFLRKISKTIFQGENFGDRVFRKTFEEKTIINTNIEMIISTGHGLESLEGALQEYLITS